MGLKASVVTPEEIRTLLEQHYPIRAVERIEPLSGGDDHCYHILAPAGEWVLKEMRINAMNHPELEPVVAQQLARDDIPVPGYLPTLEGVYVWYLREKAFHLQQFIAGQRYERNQAPDWLLRDSAELLGRIHVSLSHLPRLSDGMGLGWHKSLNTEKLREGYRHTQQMAEKQGEAALAKDAEFRLMQMPFLERFELDFARLTCRNTHGDFHLRQLICGENDIRAVIDLTTACVHPVIWEVLRSYAFADPRCKEGEIDVEHLKAYIAHYLKFGYLRAYDLRKLPHFYFYQLLRSNYIQQYLDADASGKALARDAAVWSTQLCRWLAVNADSLADELARSF